MLGNAQDPLDGLLQERTPQSIAILNPALGDEFPHGASDDPALYTVTRFQPSFQVGLCQSFWGMRDKIPYPLLRKPVHLCRIVVRPFHVASKDPLFPEGPDTSRKIRTCP